MEELTGKIKKHINNNIWYHGTVYSNWDNFAKMVFWQIIIRTHLMHWILDMAFILHHQRKGQNII